jgi:hypothetical protein
MYPGSGLEVPFDPAIEIEEEAGNGFNPAISLGIDILGGSPIPAAKDDE